MTEPSAGPDVQSINRRKKPRFSKRVIASRVTGTITILAAIITATFIIVAHVSPPRPRFPTHPTPFVRYLGVYEPDAPSSYADVEQFAQAIGRQPNLVTYYSQWLKPFQASFATSAAEHGATTLVQISPRNISLANIASGEYDSYLRTYAAAVKAFGSQVILSFGHEMNGSWYSWGYRHQSAASFVAAWRHIVTIFRMQGASNVTWLWTVNVVATANNHVPGPAPWWPGSSYVNWVGIDGYYFSPMWTFNSLFGPTIAQVRELTPDPILISETGAGTLAGQPAKIASLFDGVRTFGLLGFVWFDEDGGTAGEDWRISSPAAEAELRRESRAYMKSAS